MAGKTIKKAVGGSRILAGLIAACNDGDETAWPAMIDRLIEEGHDALAARLEYERRLWRGDQPYDPDLARHSARFVSDHLKAMDLFPRLAAVDLKAVPVASNDRRIPRKEQARLCRQLFKSLGLSHISVTTPNYSMARTIEVKIPARHDHIPIADLGFLDIDCNDPASLANRAALDKVEAILAVAFPTHDDRSDSRSDYFDARWSVYI